VREKDDPEARRPIVSDNPPYVDLLRREGVVMKYHLLFSLLFFVTPVAAQVMSDQIVVTASALPENVESTPAATTIVTRREMDDRAARDIADVLREVPGLTISRSGTPGRATSLFTRGSGSKHTLVLWNGVEITNPYFSGYDWGRFSTAGVERVEVVRGPYSALYGSDAVAGVVNVLTTPRRNELRADLEAGGDGLRNGSVAAAYAGTSTTLSASLESRSDDGFAPNDDFTQGSAHVLFRYKPSDTFSAGVAARHTTFDLGIATNLNALGTALVPSLSRRQDGSETQIAIPIEQTLGAFAYELTLAESRRAEDFEDPDDPFGLVLQTTESTTRRARLLTRTSTPIGTLVAGGEYERAEVDDVTNFGPNFTGRERSETSFFLEDRLTRALGDSRLEVSAGLRYDHYETFGSELSPRVAVAWIAGANKLRAGFGEAFRAPSIGELYTPFFGNAALEAEKSRSWELGYDRTLAGGSFAVTLFRGSYDDLIVYDFTTQTFGNVGHAQSDGLELAFDRAFGARWRGGATYTLLETEDADTGRELARRPRHSGSLSGGWRGDALSVFGVVTYVGEREDVLPVAPFSSVRNEAFTTLDANVQYHLGRFTPYVKIENLTGEEYEEVLGYPSPRRRAVVGVRFTL
jgi:vitamin B12 transporter